MQVAFGTVKPLSSAGEDWKALELARIRSVTAWAGQQIPRDHPLHSGLYFGINKMGEDCLRALEEAEDHISE